MTGRWTSVSLVVLFLSSCVRYGFEPREPAPEGGAPPPISGGDAQPPRSFLVQPVGDARLPADGAPPCPSVCNGGCPAGICVIGGAVSSAVSCPAGMPCRVDCLQFGSCLETIDCSKASGCHVRCLGEGACTGPIHCGPGPCKVECGASGTSNQCSDTIDCSEAASCDVACLGTNSCADVVCGSGRCSADCSGTNACDLVRCNESCGCAVSCDPYSCPETLCPPGCALRGGEGCTSSAAGCDSCQ